MTNKKILIGIFGLGYVGLPLAIEFGKKFNVIGYDYNSLRISQLKNKNDTNNDIYKKAMVPPTCYLPTLFINIINPLFINNTVIFNLC